MASDEWNIDLRAQKISHRHLSFSIQFDGDPTSNECEGKPSRFPDNMAALQQVRLLREAYDAYIEAFQAEKSRGGYTARSAAAPATLAPTTAPSLKAAAGKPTLSLRRS